MGSSTKGGLDQGRFFGGTLPAWLEERLFHDTTLYYPDSSPSGPDIVFVLRIDYLLFPVFVRNKQHLDDYFQETRRKLRPGSRPIYRTWPRTAHPANVKTPREGWNSDDLWDSESEIGIGHNRARVIFSLLSYYPFSTYRTFSSK